MWIAYMFLLSYSRPIIFNNIVKHLFSLVSPRARFCSDKLVPLGISFLNIYSSEACCNTKDINEMGACYLKLLCRACMYRHYLEHLLPSNAALMLQYSQQDGCQEKISLTSPHYLKYWIENNTWTCGDMEFIFECSHRYRTSERSVNDWDIECEHEKINSISPSVHVLFCLLYKQESAIP